MKKVVRAVLTLLFCLLLFGFQSAFGMRLRFFGAGFDLLPMAAVTAGVLSGAAVGGWTGFALGLMADMNRPGGICLYAGLYFLLGALAALAVICLGAALFVPYLPRLAPRWADLHVVLAFSACALLMAALLAVILALRRRGIGKSLLPAWWGIVLVCAALFLLCGIISSALEIFFILSAAHLARSLWRRCHLV